MTPRLSIVIVNFNGHGHLERCLASLAEHPPQVPHEVVVVDNASTDGSADMARAAPHVRVIALPNNVGFSAGNNAGIRATGGALILLLNNDTVVSEGAVDALVARLDAVPSAAVAGPRLIDGHGHTELSFGPMISPLAELRQKALVSLYARGVGPVSRWVERVTREEQFVDWVSGACLLVRRDVAAAAGLLDERFFLYTEDVDFCATVRAAGWKVLFTPAAVIVHLRGRSRATEPRAMHAAYRRSHLAFYAKHHPAWVPWLRLYLRLKNQLPD
ncbi:MAG TPA: glycosyltransferase family 2 protein [Vicinamibacterales bacterium]|nr:glycosyltransferase family 2 protein [Vicinamibacterales bacterium]